MFSETRKALHDEQKALVRALLSGGTQSDKYDDERLELAGQILKTKRMKAVARSWPRLKLYLGIQFEENFQTFASSIHRSSTKYHSGLLDGRLFLRFLAKQRLFPPELLFDLVVFDSSYKLKGRRLVKRSLLMRRLLFAYFRWRYSVSMLADKQCSRIELRL